MNGIYSLNDEMKDDQSGKRLERKCDIDGIPLKQQGSSVASNLFLKSDFGIQFEEKKQHGGKMQRRHSSRKPERTSSSRAVIESASEPHHRRTSLLSAITSHSDPRHRSNPSATAGEHSSRKPERTSSLRDVTESANELHHLGTSKLSNSAPHLRSDPSTIEEESSEKRGRRKSRYLESLSRSKSLTRVKDTKSKYMERSESCGFLNDLMSEAAALREQTLEDKKDTLTIQSEKWSRSSSFQYLSQQEKDYRRKKRSENDLGTLMAMKKSNSESYLNASWSTPHESKGRRKKKDDYCSMYDIQQKKSSKRKSKKKSGALVDASAEERRLLKERLLAKEKKPAGTIIGLATRSCASKTGARDADTRRMLEGARQRRQSFHRSASTPRSKIT